ncbi:hypothetical protein OKA06_20075 [Novosphingobium sp. MW5]|nr:hypothetical protein [Novosphingobium sp. MW5]
MTFELFVRRMSTFAMNGNAFEADPVGVVDDDLVRMAPVMAPPMISYAFSLESIGFAHELAQSRFRLDSPTVVAPAEINPRICCDVGHQENASSD